MLKNKTSLYFFLFFILLGSPQVFADSETPLSSQRPIVFSQPKLLNWRKIFFPAIMYSRTPIPGGGALYLFPSRQSLKFQLTVTFPQGVFSQPPQSRIILSALSDLLLTGGSGRFRFEDLQNYTNLYGIDVASDVNALGQMVLKISALPSAEKQVLLILKNILFHPQFSESSLEEWQQKIQNQFEDFIQLNSLSKQNLFVNITANQTAFGKNHYFSKYFDRMNPEFAKRIKTKEIKNLYQKIFHTAGMNVSLAGKYSRHFQDQLKKLVSKIPSGYPNIKKWLPSNEMSSFQNQKIKVLIVRKDDMTQSVLSLRYYFPNVGAWNILEKTNMRILQDVFSSAGGVVGNDRFSKALRGDSGISYAPHSYFNDQVIYPNKNMSAFFLNFQSQNDRVFEAIKLATQTFDIFLKKGITNDEMQNTKISLMNRNLATETTIFEKAQMMNSFINKEEMIFPNPTITSLLKLENVSQVKKVNDVLKRLAQNKIFPVLTILGNPSDDEIEKIKDFDQVDSVEVKGIRSTVKSFFPETSL